MSRRRFPSAFLLALLILFVATVSACGGSGAGSKDGAAGDADAARIGFYAASDDSYAQRVKDVLERTFADDRDTNPVIEFEGGTETDEGQIAAIDDFISSGCKAIVAVGNSPEATIACIERCKAAGVPYFGAVRDFSSAPNARDSAGSTAYDCVSGGYLAGQDALARGVRKVINVEGASNQADATAQVFGFLKAYEDAGLSLGGYTAERIAAEKPSVSRLDGTQAVEIVFWASGGASSEEAREAFEEALRAVGKTGFDGVYIHGDLWTEGVIAALGDAGRGTADCWIGAMSDGEVSWDWAEDGLITIGVGRPPTLEGILLYQQIKAYLEGSAYRAHLHPYFTSYT
ncbi:MAG: substrate-binding domain-containing protein, partial [Clostridiales Family XIII bacterium]|nr:substrate-binding domain-containing protein [Clostridiales Family XIII bacterium]